MTKKIAISLPEELYDWAAREVEEERAESVSALIAKGLELLAARAQLGASVRLLADDDESYFSTGETWAAEEPRGG